MTRDDKARAFRALHAGPGFVMPNAWDAGSAAVLAAEGFPALATTSAGIAFAMGLQDYAVGAPELGVGRAAMMARMAEIAAATALPVNGDLEAGWGDAPEAAAETVRLAMAAGLAGGNIEDKPPLRDGLYPADLAAARIAAARAAAAATGEDFVLTGRTDALVAGLPPEAAMAEAIARCNRFLAAGADCVYAPAPADPETVRRLKAEVRGPLNVVLGFMSDAGNARELIAAGAARVSLGGSIARAALGCARAAARELRQTGGVSWAPGGIPHGELNALFAAARSQA